MENKYIESKKKLLKERIPLNNDTGKLLLAFTSLVIIIIVKEFIESFNVMMADIWTFFTFPVFLFFTYRMYKGNR